MWSNGRSEAALEEALPAPVQIRRIRNARRLRLRFDESSGTFKLTCPWRTSRRAALAWAVEQRPWIEAQLASAQPRILLRPGTIIPIEGADTLVVWLEAAPRAPTLCDGQLRCGGPTEGVERRVASYLRKLARDVMSNEAADYAAKAGVVVKSVSVGDAATRWGSCSSAGHIRLNWRLILAPPEVRRYVVAHEVAHLRHFDHGPQFKAFEQQLFGPGLTSAKANLRRLGPGLRRLGRS
ncbi:MAG: YgjP-like metallopeptidase domain-containing protein [Sphingomicrobium sp.]